jgi:hypothetical protein
MTWHPTSLVLTAAAGVVLAVHLGVVPSVPADPVTPEAPRSLRLPSGRVVPVHAVSTGRDGLLDVPDDPRSAGWWSGGSRVGDQSGKTLLAAHVDSPSRRLGPFAELYDARPGLRLVLRSAGLSQDFRVRSVRLIPRESLTARPDLYSPSGIRQLVLVTCAPPYDPVHGGYRNLAVLVARPSGPATPTATR